MIQKIRGSSKVYAIKASVRGRSFAQHLHEAS